MPTSRLDRWSRGGLRPLTCAVGVLLILLSPVGGVMPGPGGLLMFGLGLALVLRTSPWARRRYARLMRRYPRLLRAADWGMRRRSARRRRARAAAPSDRLQNGARLTPAPAPRNRVPDPVARATGGLSTLNSKE